MSGKDVANISMGRGKIIGNGKVVAMCYEDQQMIILLKNPTLLTSTFSVHTDFYRHYSGFPPINDVTYPINEVFKFEMTLEGHEGEVFVNAEPGLIQRLLTEDITTLQMIRLVREKLEKRKI